MYKILVVAIFGLLLSCKDETSYTPASDPEEAGTQFIRASLDGNYAKARFYLLQDSTNLLLIKQQQVNYEQLSPERKKDSRDASIRPIEIKNESDSITFYKYYHTSNAKDTTTIRIVKENGIWLVDLKSILN